MSVSVQDLTFKTQAQYVADMTTAFGGSLGILPLLQEVDPELAIFNAAASQNVFVQFLLKVIWAAARLSTSSKSDVDSFVADFGMPPRLQATYAQGPVTLGALSAPTQPVLVSPGLIIQTPGGAIRYQLIADTNQPAWNASLGAYVLPAGATSISATARALVAGANQNVLAGQISQFQVASTGVDTVSNGAAITNGRNTESDAALKARFVQYLQSLSEATLAALLFAANSVQQGLDILPLESTNVALQAQPGINTFVIDDGSGSPPSILLAAVLTALDGVRAFGIQMATKGPNTQQVTAALSVLLVPNPTEPTATILANAQNAVLAYINGVQLSDGAQYLYLNNIIDVATNADPNIRAVALGSATLNGAAADLEIGVGGLPRTTLAGVTVTAG